MYVKCWFLDLVVRGMLHKAELITHAAFFVSNPNYWSFWLRPWVRKNSLQHPGDALDSPSALSPMRHIHRIPRGVCFYCGKVYISVHFNTDDMTDAVSFSCMVESRTRAHLLHSHLWNWIKFSVGLSTCSGKVAFSDDVFSIAEHMLPCSKLSRNYKMEKQMGKVSFFFFLIMTSQPKI